MRDEIELLTQLVSTASVSGTEETIARSIEAWARDAELEVACDDASLTLRIVGRAPGPVLALISHLDTVPAGEGWTRNPFVASLEGDRLYGRGSGDAKASVAAMLTACLDVRDAGGPARGTLYAVFGYGEETRDTTMPRAVERLPRIDAAIVGEPTNLAYAAAQRGLLMADLVAHGEQRHAGHAPVDPARPDAVPLLAEALTRLAALFKERDHPLLGPARVTATILEAGVSRNVVPPSARAVLDIRSTPEWTHAELIDELRRAMPAGVDVVLTSDRLIPCQSPPQSRLLAIGRALQPAALVYGSPTCSDWVFVADSDGVKCGPGTSRLSHTADEWVSIAEVHAARRLYSRWALEYLG